MRVIKRKSKRERERVMKVGGEGSSQSLCKGLLNFFTRFIFLNKINGQYRQRLNWIKSFAEATCVFLKWLSAD